LQWKSCGFGTGCSTVAGDCRLLIFRFVLLFHGYRGLFRNPLAKEAGDKTRTQIAVDKSAKELFRPAGSKRPGSNIQEKSNGGFHTLVCRKQQGVHKSNEEIKLHDKEESQHYDLDFMV
jgi:hypothetical protein